MHVFNRMNGFRGFGAQTGVDNVEPTVQTNQSLVQTVLMLRRDMGLLSAKHEADTAQLVQVVNALTAQMQQLQAQNKALARAYQAANAGIRVGYGPAPQVPSFPGQAVGVGVPTHALRNTDIDIVDGGRLAPDARVDPMAANNAHARTSASPLQSYEDAIMFSGADEDDE